MEKKKTWKFSAGSDQEESLYFGDSFPQSSTQMISKSSEQDTKHRDSHQRIENAEQLPSFCLGGGVSKTWAMRGQRWESKNLKTENVKMRKWPDSRQKFYWNLDPPMVVMIVPEKKKALARSQWLTRVMLLLGSTPALMASTTSLNGVMEKTSMFTLVTHVP